MLVAFWGGELGQVVFAGHHLVVSQYRRRGAPKL